MSLWEQVQAQRFTWNWFAIAPSVGCLACLLVAAVIWTRRPRAGEAAGRDAGRRRATFAPIAVAVGFWNLGVALAACMANDALAMPVSRLVFNCVVLAGPAAVHFTTDFARTPHRRRYLTASILLAAVTSAFIWFDPEVFQAVRAAPWGGYYPTAGERFLLAALIPIANVIMASALCLQVLRRTPPSRRRRQAAYIMISYQTALLGGVDVLGIQGANVPPLGWAASLASIAIVYYAIVRWRLMDVRTALHRTLFWGSALALTFLPIWAVVTATRTWDGWHALVPRTLVVAVTLVLLRLYVVLVLPAVRDLLGRRGRRGVAITERFATRAFEARRPDDLLAPLTEALSASAGLGLVAVILTVETAEGEGPQITALPAGTPLPPSLAWRDLPGEAVTHAELDPDEPGPVDRAASTLLDAYHADALLPVRHAGQVVGVILARDADAAAVAANAGTAGRSDRTFDELTRQILGRLASRAAVILTNAALSHALDRRSAGLGLEVKERTRALQAAIEELKAAQASLVQAEKQSSLGLLVAGVSHEINNALNFIYGNLPMLQKYAITYEELATRAAAAGARPAAEIVARAEAARGALSPAIGAVEEAAQRARSIVDDLRRFARHDEAERKLADVREGLESTLNLLGAELRGRITVERRYAADLPPIDCYPAALNHVFLNVLLNAAQAIKETGTIVVALSRPAPDRIEVAIGDDGAGIAEEDRARVFEPFFTTRRRAAGLGLAVSQQIVARHGGEIRLYANPAGQGTVVAISLPTEAARAQWPITPGV